MTEQDYTALYNRVDKLREYLRGSRCASWIRNDIRQELIARVAEIQNDLYQTKRREDALEARLSRQECPTCD